MQFSNFKNCIKAVIKINHGRVYGEKSVASGIQRPKDDIKQLNFFLLLSSKRLQAARFSKIP